MSGPITLDAAVSGVSESFESIGYQEVSRAFLLDGIPGYAIRNEADSGSAGRLLIESTIKVQGARMFLVTRSGPSAAFDQYRTEFALIRDSLEILLRPGERAIDVSSEPGEIMDTIGGRISAIRGLPPASSLEIRLQTREEFKEETKGESPPEEEHPEIERLKSLCVVLDLCAPSDDLIQAFQDTEVESVHGSYDSDNGVITLILDSGLFGPAQWTTFAHEYTHALQDAEFSLAVLEAEQTSIDSALALGALVEGDASLAEILFYESLPTGQQDEIAILVTEAAQQFSESEAITEAPSIVADTVGWRHAEGLSFVSDLYFQGGLDAVSDAFARVPQSTEQILHPEKYIDGEAPIVVTLPDLPTVLGGGWLEQDTGTLGEFLTGLYLSAFLSAEQAESAAEGWGGDRYALLEDDQGRQLIAMLYAWDSEKEGAEYHAAYLELAEAKSQGSWELVRISGTRRLWVGDDITVHIERMGDKTLVIIGPDQASVESVVDTISDLGEWVTIISN